METATYEVIIRSSQGSTGNYSLSLTETFDDHPDRLGEGVKVVTWGDRIIGTVWGDPDRDLFYLDAEAGDRVVAVSAHGDLELTLWNEDHTTEIAIDEVQRGWNLTESGRYVLDVRQDPSARFSTSYDFALISDDHPDTPIAATVKLEAGVTLAGTLHVRQETDTFRFDFSPGRLTEIRIVAEQPSRFLQHRCSRRTGRIHQADTTGHLSDGGRRDALH